MHEPQQREQRGVKDADDADKTRGQTMLQALNRDVEIGLGYELRKNMRRERFRLGFGCIAVET